MKLTTKLFLLILFPTFVWASDTLSPLMQQNRQTLMDLQKYAVNPEKFNDPKHKEEILHLIENLSTNSHRLPKALESQKRSSLAAIAAIFSSYLNSIENNFKKDRRDYVRYQVLTVSGFCASCHTEMTSSKSFQETQKEIEALPLTLLQKMELYAATRRFDKALETFEHLNRINAFDDTGLRELLSGLKIALSISIRVKQDPTLTLHLVNMVSSKKALPLFLKEFLNQWKKDTLNWQKERPLPQGSTATQLL